VIIQQQQQPVSKQLAGYNHSLMAEIVLTILEGTQCSHMTRSPAYALMTLFYAIFL